MAKSTQASAIVLVDEKKRVLVLQRSNAVESYKGYWNFPAGSMDQGEAPMECAIRECLEETSLLADKDFVSYIGTFGVNSLTSVTQVHYFISNNYSGNLKIDWESDGFKWVYLEDIDFENFIPVPTRALETIKYWIDTK